MSILRLGPEGQTTLKNVQHVYFVEHCSSNAKYGQSKRDGSDLLKCCREHFYIGKIKLTSKQTNGYLLSQLRFQTVCFIQSVVIFHQLLDIEQKIEVVIAESYDQHIL